MPFNSWNLAEKYCTKETHRNYPPTRIIPGPRTNYLCMRHTAPEENKNITKKNHKMSQPGNNNSIYLKNPFNENLAFYQQCKDFYDECLPRNQGNGATYDHKKLRTYSCESFAVAALVYYQVCC